MRYQKRICMVIAGSITAGLASGASAGSTPDEVTPVEALNQVVPTIMEETVHGGHTPMSIDQPLDIGGGVRLYLDFDYSVDVDMSMAGLSVFDDSHHDADTVVQAVGDAGEQRVMQIIESAEGPTQFEYELDLPVGVSARVIGDGSVVVEDASGSVITAVERPWAADANGDSVPTWFEVVDDTLVQHVDHEGAQYPVVSDPLPAWAVVQIIRCGFGGYLAWISSAGWRWYWRAASLIGGCFIGMR